MANLLYLDCFSGAAGDMLLAALIDLGFAPARLTDLTAALNLPGVEVEVRRVKRGAIAAPLVKVAVAADQPHRHWQDIDEMIAGAELPASVKANARRVFRRLAEAEGAVHGHAPEEVHFHEVGAIDAIVDIVGVCLALDDLQIAKIIAGPLPLGRGTVVCAHGVLPLPAPAVVALLRGAPVTSYPLDVETVTPTGAALISTLADSYGPAPSMVLLQVGYGAGSREDPAGPPNVLRLLLGDDRGLPETAETTYVIEANIDDMNPEYYEPLGNALEAAGALDTTLIPCVMKRGRPGVLLKVICPQSALDSVIETIFTHSTTLGLRYFPTERAVCERRMETVGADFGPVRIKHAYYKGKLVGSKPEYQDLLKSGLPIAEALRRLEKVLR